MNTFKLIIGIASGTIILIAFLNIIQIIYICYKKLALAEGFLKSSDWISRNKLIYSSSGWIGNIYKLNAITIVLLMPALCARRGLAEMYEIKKFPTNLKFLILSSFWLGFFCLVFATLIIIINEIYA